MYRYDVKVFNTRTQRPYRFHVNARNIADAMRQTESTFSLSTQPYAIKSIIRGAKQS